MRSALCRLLHGFCAQCLEDLLMSFNNHERCGMGYCGGGGICEACWLSSWFLLSDSQSLWGPRLEPCSTCWPALRCWSGWLAAALLTLPAEVLSHNGLHARSKDVLQELAQ